MTVTEINQVFFPIFLFLVWMIGCSFLTAKPQPKLTQPKTVKVAPKATPQKRDFYGDIKEALNIEVDADLEAILGMPYPELCKYAEIQGVPSREKGKMRSAKAIRDELISQR